MPASFRKASGFSGSRVSILMVTTSNLSPPSAACNLSSAGISLRQGTHQVAHRFKSTVRPRQSESCGQPLRILEGEVGDLDGVRATVSAAISPCASGAIRLAAATAGAQPAAAGLLRSPPIPYTPASTAKIAAPPRKAVSIGHTAGRVVGRLGRRLGH